MTPADLKAASEQLLRGRGIPVNAHLPCIEAEEIIQIRSVEDVLQRMIALWAVAGTAFNKDSNEFRDYVDRNGIQSWLTTRERKFMLADKRPKRESLQLSWRLEALYFLAWCAGLVGEIAIPTSQSNLDEVVHLFPSESDAPSVLARHIVLRPKIEIVAWADLLYRLHWAVRDAHLNGGEVPGGLVAGTVYEWHYAVNWITSYQGEDDWDHIGTDT